jgi:hypothetical protein
MQILWYCGLGVLYILLGLAILWMLNRLLGWNLDLLTTNSGALQSWIYILQTVILVGTLVYIGKQSAAVERTIRVNTVQLMVDEHRELLGKILEQPRLLDALTGTDLPVDKALRVYLSMFLNHGFNAFNLRQQGYIDDDWWAAIIRDMRDVMRTGAMQKWWKEVGQDYPSRYQNFVNRCILSEQQEMAPCGN